MTTDMRRRPIAILLALCVVAGIAGLLAVGDGTPGGAPAGEVTLPDLSPRAAAGKDVFNANCAECHGRKAAGSDKGPPLVHRVYHPDHHADLAFFLAAKNGVLQHHWTFGDMPAQPQVDETQVAAVVRYVRELQIANGIFESVERE